MQVAKLVIGLVGAGSIAQSHLRAFVESPLVDKVFLADPSDQARENTVRQFGIVERAFETIEEMLGSAPIDVVDICTPHYLHKPQAIVALQAGKHVIVEKPMAMNVAECDEMLEAAAGAGRRLFVALCQRMFPAHIRARQLIEEGEIGQPFLGVVNVFGNEMERMRDTASWKGSWEKAGGGALFDTGYHAVYMLQHFLGPARAVIASLKQLAMEDDRKADDTGMLAMEMDGAMGCVTATYAATGDRWTEERRIVGEQGSLLIRDDPDDGLPLLLLRGEEVIPVPVVNPLRVHPYGVARVLEHFLECIVKEEPEQVTAAEARAAVAVCQAAYESAREGRKVEVVL